jgi:hypothetical protein
MFPEILNWNRSEGISRKAKEEEEIQVSHGIKNKGHTYSSTKMKTININWDGSIKIVTPR